MQFLKVNDHESEYIEKSRNLPNFDQLPLSHEHIIRTILLYSDSETLLVCEKVCSTWNWWISSSRIWTEMLAAEGARAKSLSSSIRYCSSGVGEGWLDDCASEFVINRLEHLAEGAKKVAKEECKDKVKKRAIHIDRLIKDTNHIMRAEQYEQLVFDLLRREERHIQMKDQKESSEIIRSSLVDWMVDIGEECAFKTETVHQAVGIVDMALCHGLEENQTPQVLAITALRVAAEFEEEDAPPSLYDLYSDATGDEFTEKEISDNVDLLLRKLHFNWNLTSSHQFISKLSQMNNAKSMTIHLSQYLSDLVLVSGPSPGSSSFSPSFIASSCLASAHQFLGLDIWPSCMVSITGYTLDQLFDSITYITRLHKNARRSEYQAVVKKYMESDYYCVAMLDHPLRSNAIFRIFSI